MTNMFLPCGVATGIGSLPHSDVQRAIDLVAIFCPTLPFWPQLPQRAPEEAMIAQVLLPVLQHLEPRRHHFGYHIPPQRYAVWLEASRTTSPKLTMECAAGFFALERALGAGRFPDARALKGQLVGPITAGSQLFCGDGSILQDARAVRVLGEYLTRLGRWQIERLRQWELPVLLVIDEPALPVIATFSPETSQVLLHVLQTMVANLKSTGALIGIHCCATPAPFDLLSEATPDMISLDVTHDSVGFGVAAAQRFLADGGMIAFGLIPTVTALDTLDPAILFAAWLLAASQLGDLGTVARQTLITATCGLGLLSEAAAQQSFRLSTQVGHLVQRIAVP